MDRALESLIIHAWYTLMGEPGLYQGQLRDCKLSILMGVHVSERMMLN